MNYNTEQSLCAFWWKKLEIKVESIPETLSGCCLAERCGLLQVLHKGLHNLPCGGWESLDTAQSLHPSMFLTTLHMEDLLLISRFCLNVFFPKSDAVEAGVAQLSM